MYQIHLGFGAAGAMLSTFTSCRQATLRIDGYSESVSTTSIVSGLWTAAYASGNFLGPTVGGILVEQVEMQ